VTIDRPPTTSRSRRIYVLWAIALTLLISTALFCWLVVVPVWQVRRAVERAYTGEQAKLLVRELGGPKLAAARLRNLRRMPSWISDLEDQKGNLLGGMTRWDRYVLLLSWCEKPGVEVLAKLMHDESVVVAVRARSKLEYIAGHVNGVDAVTVPQSTGHKKPTRQAAADALKKIEDDLKREVENWMRAKK
jgi:hypothetical protein